MTENIDNKIHCPKCHTVIRYAEGLKSGDLFRCPCGKIDVELFEVKVLKGKIAKEKEWL